MGTRSGSMVDKLPNMPLKMFNPRTIEELSQEHPLYQASAPVWRTIAALHNGFPSIKANVEKYLPRRPVEDQELYTLRTAKLAYSPVMSSIVSTYTGKMAKVGVNLPESLPEVWKLLRTNNSRPGETKRSESSLLSEVFTSILLYGRVHVVTDIPDVQARSTYELRKAKVTPYFTVLSPLEVINWGEGWMVMKQFIQTTKAFEPNATLAVFTYVGQGVRATYEVPVKLEQVEDSESNLYPSIHRVMWKGEWEKPNDDMRFDVTSVTDGVGIDRVVTSVADVSKWLCLTLYNKQIQHLRIENAWTDAGYLSGTVQRVFTPNDAKPNDDPRVAYSKQDNKELAMAGNQHILIGKGYSFVESSGTALANLEGMLDKIEHQMKEIANLHFASGAKGALQQSGTSKAADMSLLNGNLSEYGSLVLDIYNELLLKVSTMLQIPSVEAEGLSDFKEEEQPDMVNIINAVTPLADFPLIGKAALYRKLLEDLDISFSDVDKLVLEGQLELKAPLTPQTQPLPTNNISV